MRDDFENNPTLIAIHLPFESQSPPPQTQEINLSLRKPQQLALSVLLKGWEGPGLLQLPCGIGKTVVAGAYLQTVHHKCVVVVSPLLVHAKQTLNRLRPFLPNHKHELVDSDTDGMSGVGLTQPDDPTLFSTTFKSFPHFLRFKALFIIDEAHNLAGEMLEQVSALDQALLMTATPPKLLEPVSKVLFSYSMRDAINEGLICDYSVVLPVMEEVEIPAGVINSDLARCCLFLVSGMLQKGSRKCIVYCSSIQECADFESAFANVCTEYHGIDPFTSQISTNTHPSERTRVLSEFQLAPPDKLCVLCSVRILNEGIDIPECDSVCITKTTANEITAVQRLCRANRKVERQPHKRAHCFVYSDDLDSCVEMLASLKHADPEFFSKISLANYDS